MIKDVRVHKRLKNLFAATTATIWENCGRRGASLHQSGAIDERTSFADSNQVKVRSSLGRKTEQYCSTKASHLCSSVITLRDSPHFQRPLQVFRPISSGFRRQLRLNRRRPHCVLRAPYITSVTSSSPPLSDAI